MLQKHLRSSQGPTVMHEMVTIGWYNKLSRFSDQQSSPVSSILLFFFSILYVSVSICRVFPTIANRSNILMLTAANLTTVASRREEIYKKNFSILPNQLHACTTPPRTKRTLGHFQAQNLPEISYTRTKRYCSCIHYAINYYQDSIQYIKPLKAAITISPTSPTLCSSFIGTNVYFCIDLSHIMHVICTVLNMYVIQLSRVV